MTNRENRKAGMGNRILFPAFLFSLFIFPPELRADDWQIAEPGLRYAFPREHGAHPAFKTEWWYFTGNLRDEHGREFGYQLTFFRHGIRRAVAPESSRFLVRDLNFAHFTISDLQGGDFFFLQKMSRGAFGEAGSGEKERLAWIDTWKLTQPAEGIFEIAADDEKHGIELRLSSARPPVIQGENGVSQKAAGSGHGQCGKTDRRRPCFQRHRRDLVRSRMGDQPARAGADWVELVFAATLRWLGSDAL